jgi:hypothetical protein
MKKMNIVKILANMFSKNSGGDAHVNEDLSYYHNERDAKDNNSTTPPSEEKVRVPSIWAFEVYTPSTISNLYIGIKNLELSNSMLGIDSHHEDSIRNLRFRAFGGGWINVGTIYDESVKTFIPATKTKLPKGILSIRFSVLQNMPSITILICQFIFDEETANSLNVPLSRNFTTYTEKIKTGLRIVINVPHQKKKQTEITRAYLRSLCTSWIAKNMPGYFSLKSLQNLLPTCELILLNKHNPMDKIGDRIYDGNLDNRNEWYYIAPLRRFAKGVDINYVGQGMYYNYLHIWSKPDFYVSPFLWKGIHTLRQKIFGTWGYGNRAPYSLPSRNTYFFSRYGFEHFCQ